MPFDRGDTILILKVGDYMFDNDSNENENFERQGQGMANNDYPDITLAEQIVYAMFKPSKYKEMIRLKKGRFAGFAVVMMLVIGIVTAVIPTGAVITGFGGFEKLFSKQMADLSYSDGRLSKERPFELSFDYYNFLIDTSEKTPTDEMLKKQGLYIALGSENMRIAYVLDNQIVDYQIYPLSDYFSGSFDNKALISAIPAIYITLFITFVILCIGLFIRYAFIAWVFSLLINSINKKANLGLLYRQVFQICFYGQTFGMLLSNFNMAAGLLPSVFVSIFVVFYTIHMITAATALIQQDAMKL